MSACASEDSLMCYWMQTVGTRRRKLWVKPGHLREAPDAKKQWKWPQLTFPRLQKQQMLEMSGILNPDPAEIDSYHGDGVAGPAPRLLPRQEVRAMCVRAGRGKTPRTLVSKL